LIGLELPDGQLQEEISPFQGGETEALRRMKESLQDKVGASGMAYSGSVHPSVHLHVQFISL